MLSKLRILARCDNGDNDAPGRAVVPEAPPAPLPNVARHVLHLKPSEADRDPAPFELVDDLMKVNAIAEMMEYCLMVLMVKSAKDSVKHRSWLKLLLARLVQYTPED